MADRAIILRIDNKEPINLPSFTAALSALSADYAKMTGRQLSVGRVETGSIILTLLDWAGKANDLFDFVRNIQSMWGSGSGGAIRLDRSRKVGAKSALALAELAIQSHAELELYEKEPDGREISIRVTPPKARALRERQESLATRPAPQRLIGIERSTRAERELEGYAIAALEHLNGGEGGADSGPSGLMEIIKALVEVIRTQAGGEATLKRVATRLRQRGFNADALLGV